MDPITPQTPAAPRPGNWWQRNWKWFVPTGCFSLMVLAVLAIGGIVMLVFGAMKSSDVYKTAVARAKANPEVIEALGSPVREGMFLSGNTNVSNGSGQADLAIPISGPKGKGRIHAVATKSDDRWTYSKLTVEIESTGESIDLGSADTSGDANQEK